MVVMLHQDCINGRRLRRVTCGCHVASGLHQWEEAQEGDLWLSCCHQDCINGRRLRRVTCGCHVVVMLHQDCINGRRLRRVTCGCQWEEAQEGDLWLQQWEEAQEGDLWLSCCIRTASMGGGSGGPCGCHISWLSPVVAMGGGSGG